MPAKPALVSESVGNIGNQNVVGIRKQRPETDAGKGCDGAVGNHTHSKAGEICWAQFPPAAVVATGTRAADSLRDRWAESPAWWRAPPPAASERRATTPGTTPLLQGQRGGAGRAEPRRERTTQRSEVVRALETKFLLFAAGQEQDSVLSWSPAPRPPQLVSIGCVQPTGSAASNLAGPGLRGPGSCLDRRLSRKLHCRSTPVLASLPVRLRRSLRLRPPSPFASSRSAADEPGPPERHMALRGGRRCRRNASRLQSGTPTTRGRLRPDPGGGREVGHFPWHALGRFRARDRHLGRRPDRRSPGRRGPWCSGCTSLPPVLVRASKYLETCPRPSARPGNTKTDYLLGHGCVFQGGWGFLRTPFWQGVGIIAARFAAGIWIYSRSEEHTSELQS